MMLWRCVLVWIGLIGIFCGCRKQTVTDCFKSRGEDGTLRRELTAFSTLTVNDKLDVVLVQDSASAEYAILYGGKNVIQSVDFHVKDSALNIKDLNSCNWVRSFKDRIKIELHLHGIRKLNVHDDASVKTVRLMNSSGLTIMSYGVNDIDLELNVTKGFVITTQYSAGNITLRGSGPFLASNMYDASSLYAGDFLGDYIWVWNYGSGDGYFKPYKEFGPQVFYTGSIYYNQEPLSYHPGKHTGSGKMELVK